MLRSSWINIPGEEAVVVEALFRSKIPKSNHRLNKTFASFATVMERMPLRWGESTNQHRVIYRIRENPKGRKEVYNLVVATKIVKGTPPQSPWAGLLLSTSLAACKTTIVESEKKSTTTSTATWRHMKCPPRPEGPKRVQTMLPRSSTKSWEIHHSGGRYRGDLFAVAITNAGAEAMDRQSPS